VPDFFCPEPTVPLVTAFIRAGVVLSGHDTNNEIVFEANCVMHGVAPGESFHLKKYRDIKIRVFAMHHSVPCVGYGFSKTKTKLKKEYADLKGQEIGKLRKDGVEVSEEFEERLFVFCGDTTSKVFELSPEILQYQIVIIECSFFKEEERAKAKKSHHILWQDLKPVVVANPQVRFILMHLSMRYKTKEIKEFFEAENVDNVELMLQDDDDDYGSTFGRAYVKK
jgi:ribonuclease Z